MSQNGPTARFLRSVGFEFSQSSRRSNLPRGYTFERLLTRHHRLECRKVVSPEEYGAIFEGTVGWLLRYRFAYDFLRNVQIHDEGTGGDYDILAFSSPHLLYLECKSGREIGFKDILRRHEFLRPALTLILIDKQKDEVEKEVTRRIQPILTADAKQRDPHIAKVTDYQYSVALISEPGASYVLYHTRRNLFIASGEEVERAVQRALRHFHQVVQQTSYWS